MMDGITVLNVVEHVVRGWGWNNIILLLLILAGAFIALSFFIWNCKEIALGDICMIIGVFLIIISILISSQAKIVKTYNTYEVTIDDTVSWSELNEHYEIVSQRGNIIEIKERNTD